MANVLHNHALRHKGQDAQLVFFAVWPQEMAEVHPRLLRVLVQPDKARHEHHDSGCTDRTENQYSHNLAEKMPPRFRNLDELFRFRHHLPTCGVMLGTPALLFPMRASRTAQR